jgi:branched-chain amino acid transport system permease protein
MQEVLQFALLGLGTGALIAGIAVGVVVTYRGSGVINLAVGALAMVAGYVFWSLRTGFFGFSLTTAPALCLTLLATVLIGLLIEVAVFRALRTSSPLAKMVASLGVLLTLQAGALLIFGTDAKAPPDILPTGAVTVLGVTLPVNRFWLTAIVIAATVLLWALYRWSRFGLATRAAAEDEVSGMLAGLSPNELSMANSALAALVAGLIGILAAPLVQVDSTSLPLQIVPALAAALFARFTSLGIACAAGILIGAAESILYYVSTLHWFPTDNGNPLPGIQALLTFVIIVVALSWRGRSVPGRGELVERRLPAAPAPGPLARPALVLSAGCALALVVLPYDYRQALILSLIGMVVCLSLVVITGFVGQVSLAQVALAGVSGFVVSRLATGAGVGFPWAPILGSLAATTFGLVIGVSALRIRGVSLAVVTMAGAVAIEQFGFNNTTWGAGTTGSPVPAPTFAGLHIGSDAGFRGLDGNLPSPVIGFAFLIVVACLCLLVANLRRSTFGQRMLAVRSNERAAAAAGINVARVKMVAFAISSFIAGTAGWMYAYSFGSVSAGRFGILTAFAFVAFAYIGGITMISGAILGGLVVTQGLFAHFFESTFGISGTWTLFVGGVVLVLNMITAPEGIAGATLEKKKRRRRAGRLNVLDRIGQRFAIAQPREEP